MDALTLAMVSSGLAGFTTFICTANTLPFPINSEPIKAQLAYLDIISLAAQAVVIIALGAHAHMDYVAGTPAIPLSRHLCPANDQESAHDYETYEGHAT